MINFKGVTPPPAPKTEPPAQPQRMSVQEPAPQVDAPQMKKQLSQDTVSFSGGKNPVSQYAQTKILIKQLGELGGNKRDIEAYEELARKNKKNPKFLRKIDAKVRDKSEIALLSK